LSGADDLPMKLRSQISLLLFMFGLVPLLVGFAINVPMIFDRIEKLYHKAHLQNLRAGFGDLDQHIARRHEMARLLAKMPEPGFILDAGEPQSSRSLEQARKAYLDWVNQALLDQFDINEILYVDEDGVCRFWLDRNSQTGLLEAHKGVRDGFDQRLVNAGSKLNPGGVLTGPIVFDRAAETESPSRFMQLSLVSPIVIPTKSEDSGEITEKRGTVIMYLDMGGLASAYRGNYWVQSDGHYLGSRDGVQPARSAFEDFHGLEEVFARGELALWEYQGQQVMWVPLFYTYDAGPLWVGRSVDPSPLTMLRRTVEGRIAIIALGLLLVVFVVARLLALRVERFGHELTDGISQVLERDEAVSFSWQRPQELHELGENLTRLAVTHAEHNKALYDYAQELEASNRYKSEFLANVSHELRTPLNSILLLSKMLADCGDGNLSEEGCRQARIIHAAGSDLKALIDNILDLSRIEARQMTLVPETIYLRKLLDDILELLKPQFDEKHLELWLEVGEGVPDSIVSDSEKLRQILVNFLSNAVKFTREGGVTVRLLHGINYPVAISVTDTGIGIPVEKRELIFEAFKQADGSTSRRFGGTGLGLTISRELATLIGGRIEVESEAGRGSTFTLLLPAEIPAQVAARDEAGAAAHRSDRKGGHLPVADYHAARVLLVDDDMRNLLALTPLLEQWKLDVMAAGDGVEALETLQAAGPFDLVILDIMMPDMDGYELTRRLRKDQRFAALPVIALTARAGAEEQQAALEAGADAFLAKPVEPAELKDMLDKFLAVRSSSATPQSVDV
jgi:signal transduction histidine kinase/ActR/RegA family two-component response regulator